MCDQKPNRVWRKKNKKKYPTPKKTKPNNDDEVHLLFLSKSKPECDAIPRSSKGLEMWNFFLKCMCLCATPQKNDARYTENRNPNNNKRNLKENREETRNSEGLKTRNVNKRKDLWRHHDCHLNTYFNAWDASTHQSRDEHAFIPPSKLCCVDIWKNDLFGYQVWLSSDVGGKIYAERKSGVVSDGSALVLLFLRVCVLIYFLGPPCCVSFFFCIVRPVWLSTFLCGTLTFLSHVVLCACWFHFSQIYLFGQGTWWWNIICTARLALCTQTVNLLFYYFVFIMQQRTMTGQGKFDSDAQKRRAMMHCTCKQGNALKDEFHKISHTCLFCDI